MDSFGEDNAAKQFQAMAIDPLSETKRFVVTENKGNADAVLRSHTLEKVRHELHFPAKERLYVEPPLQTPPPPQRP